VPRDDGGRLSWEGTALGERATTHLRNSQAAQARYGSPLEWPELQTIWRIFESTWGNADRPRQTNDPRVKVVLERFSAGWTVDELTQAIRASKRYAPVADNPSFRRIKTILKDDEQVDNLLRLAGSPDARKTRLAQHGGWKAPKTERIGHA